AAEIGMEHKLGPTYDPIGGLVQIPCIERNAMGPVQAINAVRMAMRGDGKHKVILDKAIKTMRDTGRDIRDQYKAPSRGGVAVNVIECCGPVGATLASRPIYGGARRRAFRDASVAPTGRGRRRGGRRR